jgi:hypothetical protein
MQQSTTTAARPLIYRGAHRTNGERPSYLELIGRFTTPGYAGIRRAGKPSRAIGTVAR